VFSSGSIWAPLRCRWAQEVVEEMAGFPYGESDDMHYAAVWGLLRMRRGGLRIASDEEDDPYVRPPAREFDQHIRSRSFCRERIALKAGIGSSSTPRFSPAAPLR
jgi:hypothetical protein